MMWAPAHIISRQIYFKGLMLVMKKQEDFAKEDDDLKQ